MAEITKVRDAQTGDVIFDGKCYQAVEDWYAGATGFRRVQNAWEVASEFRACYLSRHQRGEFWVAKWL